MIFGTTGSISAGLHDRQVFAIEGGMIEGNDAAL